MSTYKLTYFDMRGRAECSRLLFTYAGVGFEDVRLTGDQWGALKPSTPWGQVPILEVDGEVLAQSNTIARFLGRKFQLCGESDWEAAKCDEYVDATNDLFEQWAKFVFFEQDPVKKAALRETFVTTLAPKCLEVLEAIKQKNGGDFLVGKVLTWADINIADKLQILEDTVKADILRDYPGLAKFKAVVFAVPKLKEYIEKTAYSYKAMMPEAERHIDYSE